ncbi:hydroxyacid dehydrogenase [Patescibacteria group bacterium]|nr:hydroxyacid dehydrogenase [Patescibacteria group bacterium]
MKIAFYEIEGWEEAAIKQAFPSDEIYLSKDKIDELNLPAKGDYEVISTFVSSKITSKVLDQFPNLKLIATRSTGFDHIDCVECAKRNIAVVYVPSYGVNTVAEFAFGLILNLTRKIYQAIDQMKETSSFSLDGLRGTDIKGKTLGVIGTGHIGTEVVKIAKGFGMDVLAYDPYPNKDFEATMGFKYVTLEELLKGSDVVTIHTPYNNSTHHLINKGNISFMKKGAYLINTARGAIVETDALVEALQSGALGGAGLDVLEEGGEVKDELELLVKTRENEEELRTMLEDHVLMKLPNVLITPHTAFNSQEAVARILGTTLDNIKAFVGGKPTNLVPQGQ